MRPKLLTLRAFYALLWAIFDSHRGNVNNFGPHDPQIINITSVLRTFWEIIDSHRGNVNNFGPHDPQMLNSTSVLRMFKQFLIPLNWTYPPALGFLLPAQTLILCLESKPTCHKIAMIESWRKKGRWIRTRLAYMGTDIYIYINIYIYISLSPCHCGICRYQAHASHRSIWNKSQERSWRFPPLPESFSAQSSQFVKSVLNLIVAFWGVPPGLRFIIRAILYAIPATCSVWLAASFLSWKATKEYLNQRGAKTRVFRMRFRAPFLPPFFSSFSPLSFPFRPCSLSHHFSPLRLPLYCPLFSAPGKLRFRYPSNLGTLWCPADFHGEIECFYALPYHSSRNHYEKKNKNNSYHVPLSITYWKLKFQNLSGSHRSTRIASDLASRALASQAKPQRESESQAFRIARSLKTCRFFASQANIAGFSQTVFAAFSCDFRSS